jgi:ribosomal-protein-alanine acetyltransferase
MPDMIRLEHQSSTAAHWSVAQYESLFQADDDSRIALVAESDQIGRDDVPRVLGFLIARNLGPEWELENIVVALEARKRGIGLRLMEQLLARAQQTNSETVFLEVRESNAPAISLYEKLGFQQTGRRKSYYNNPVEDALLYRKSLGQPPISS